MDEPSQVLPEEKSAIPEQEPRMSDERLKMWIELGKWAVASVGLVIMTTIINAGFKDREVGLNEIKEYDKYVKMVTDNTKISERRLLAQFYAYVTPSEKLKEGWQDYLAVVEQEIKDLEAKKAEKIEQLEEPTRLSDQKREQLQQEVEKIDEELTPTFDKTLSRDYDAAISWEKLGFQRLYERDLEGAIQAFNNSERSYNTFHQVYDIARYLRSKRSDSEDQDDQFWKEVYQTILRDYPWRMTEETKTKLRQLSN